MKLNFILIISVLYILQSCNQNLKNKIKYYPDKTVKEIYYIDKNGNAQGKSYTFYENGKIKEIRNYSNNNSNGYCYFFRKNGSLETIGKFKSNLEIDTTFNFYNTGYLLNKVIYNNKGEYLEKFEYFDKGNIKGKYYNQLDSKNSIPYINSSVEYKENGEIDRNKSRYIKIKEFNQYLKLTPIIDSNKKYDSIKIVKVSDIPNLEQTNFSILSSKKVSSQSNIIIYKKELTNDINYFNIEFWYNLNSIACARSMLVRIEKGKKPPKNNLHPIFYLENKNYNKSNFLGEY